MGPLKFQHAYLWQIRQLCILLMVFIPWITAFHETEGDKTYNVKIGFDLTHGSKGASSLRIRNFEENDGAEYAPPALRAELPTSSSSSIEENQNSEKKKGIPEIAVEMKAAEDSAQSEDSDDSVGDRPQRSTKGLRADEYEPQGPEVREAFDQDSESENSN